MAEHTGQARTTCTCGLDTGLIPTAEAITTARAHRRPPNMTTAEKLISYRAELIAGGFTPENAEAMAKDAGYELLRHYGLVTEPSDASSATEASDQG
ncbi:hypothetical protein [Streptomyces sp. NPDC001876]|uniref:hypothetical protein n=1 Tax=Streptomyces sp. NPDC001876 TaxID=3154402 RepID=UPI00331CC3F3